MKHLIPVLAAMVWPVTLGIILWMFRKNIKSIVNALDKRICEGAGVKIGGIGVDAATNDMIYPGSPKNAGDTAPSGGPSVDVSDDQAQRIFLGVRLEIYLNKEVAESMLGDLERLLRGNGLIPLRRLNTKATAGFLQWPPVPLDDPTINLSWIYLQEITIFNRLVDSIDNPSAPDDFKRGRIVQALTFKKRLSKSGLELQAALDAKCKA